MRRLAARSTEVKLHRLDGQVYTAGAAVGWLERVGLISGAGQLDALCEEASAGTPEAQFIPGLAGLGAPFWAPEARGAWVGLSLASSREDLVAAVIWGIAAQVATLARAMASDLGAPLATAAGRWRAHSLTRAAPGAGRPASDPRSRSTRRLTRRPSAWRRWRGSGRERLPAPSDAVGEWSPTLVVEPLMPAAQAHERLEHFTQVAATVAGMSAS